MRTKLPNRRPSETRKVPFELATGKVQNLIITVGFDEDGLPKEVFCADFKAGSDLHALVMDTCVLVSRALQFGDVAEDLAASMCKGPSLIGAILAVVADCRGEPRARDGEVPTDPPPGGGGIDPGGATAAAELAMNG